MTVIHFTGVDHDNVYHNPVYHVNIDGTPYRYDWNKDILWNVRTGKVRDRLELPDDVLRAFHEAWDPDSYMAAIQNPPTDADGIPLATQDPSSPVYYPVKPEGEPAEVR